MEALYQKTVGKYGSRYKAEKKDAGTSVQIYNTYLQAILIQPGFYVVFVSFIV